MRWVCLAALVFTAGCKKSALKTGAQDVPPDFISTNCNSDLECDDSDPCTDDVCGSDMMCTNMPKDCSSVVDDCNSASCDPANGDCIGKPKREGRTCADPFFGDPGTCMQGTCAPVPQCQQSFDFLSCTPGSNVVMDTTTNSSNTFSKYTCADGLTGPEISYSFYVSIDRTVTFTLDSAVDLDLIVLSGDLCTDTAACTKQSLTVGSGHETVSFAAKASAYYTVVVEGRDGAMGPYTLSADCTGCQPIQTLDCNMSIVGDTGSTNATNTLNNWTCDAAPGQEETYTITPVTNTDYTIKLTGLSQDLDLIITEQYQGTCDYFCTSDSTTIKAGNSDEQLVLNATAGTLYYAVIDSKSATSSYMLEVDCDPTCLGTGKSFSCTTGSDTGRNDDPKKSTNRASEWKNCDSDTTGREVIYHFVPLTTGTYDFSLTGLTADLDLIVVEGTATTCDPTMLVCLDKSVTRGLGDEHISFPATAGHDYYIAVDGYNGAAGQYTLRINSASCPAWECSSSTSPILGCTWLEDARRNDDPGRSKNVVDAWTCDPDASGPEVVYVFTPPQDGDYTVTLDQLGADLDVLVLGGTTCNPAGSCSASLRVSPSPSPSPDPTPSPEPLFAPESVTFHGLMGKAQYLVVDGRSGAAGSYHLKLSGDCPAPICKNGSNSLSCLTTSTTNANDAGLATNDISSWGPGGSACATGTNGPEFAHLFTPNSAGPFTVTLSALNADLDLIVLEAGTGSTCTPTATCMGASQNPGTANDAVTFTADPAKKYWLIVDGKDGATSTYKLQITAGCI